MCQSSNGDEPEGFSLAATAKHRLHKTKSHRIDTWFDYLDLIIYTVNLNILNISQNLLPKVGFNHLL